MRWLGRVEGKRVMDPRQVHESVAAPGLAEGAWVEVNGADLTPFAEPGSALGEIAELATGKGHTPFLPDACEAEAAAWVKNPGIDDPNLVDLTHLPFVTIDYTTSKDLDQALFVERKGQNHVVWYALADAAYYVRPGSALLEEAIKRGATYYMPGLTIPMLPLALCEGLISINPNVDRRAMVFRMEIGRNGACKRTEVIRARVHSVAKLAYRHVQAWYDGGEAPTDNDGALQSLSALQSVGELRMAEAEARNVIRFRRREVDVKIADGSAPFLAREALRHDVERYGEQISLLTNVEGARLLADPTAGAHVHPVYRTHAPPQSQRLRQLQRQIDAIVRAHNLPPTWRWSGQRHASLATYLRSLPRDGAHARIARVIEHMALFTGGRSGFSAEPAGHHGVGADVYARFTAPMREVVGIFVHKEAWEHLGAQTPTHNATDEALREQVIDAAGRAKSQQRALTQTSNRRCLDRMFQADLDGKAAPRGGTIMGFSRGKIRVELNDPPIQVKVYFPHLQEYIGTALRLTRDGSRVVEEKGGRRVVTLGDRVQVTVLRQDEDRDRWVLGLDSVG
ncbi:MAG: ribonuclease catalytic domain-containing protein [Myxococcota bacterium]